jgi:hypothetical protein
MTWKRMVQERQGNIIPYDFLLSETWDGVGDYFKGVNVLNGRAKDMYTMEDIK